MGLKIREKLLGLVARVPLFRVFTITSGEHIRGAVHELWYVIFFTALPMLVSCGALYISLASEEPISALTSDVAAKLFKGELFIAAASLIGTVFFVIAKNFKVPPVMLDRTWLIIISLLVLIACTTFFVSDRLAAAHNPSNLVRLSLIIYSFSLVVAFVALSYKNHFEHLQPPNPQDFQRSKRSVIDDLTEHPHD